jgi:hypothetical protein
MPAYGRNRSGDNQMPSLPGARSAFAMGSAAKEQDSETTPPTPGLQASFDRARLDLPDLEDLPQVADPPAPAFGLK